MITAKRIVDVFPDFGVSVFGVSVFGVSVGLNNDL